MGWGGDGVGSVNVRLHLRTKLMLRWGRKQVLGQPAKVLKRKCFQVKHVKMEFTRKARGPKTHGAQCIDRKWSSLKKFIPKELASKPSNGGLNAQIQE